jgi:alpha-L-fucosidase
MIINRKLTFGLAASFIGFSSVAQENLMVNASPIMQQEQTKTANEQKVKWFREAKFGMFIHWGLFSQQAGIYNEKRYYGVSEWIQQRAKIPALEYEKYAKDFNPSQFNAEEWVAVAKASGIKYIVITAKHHDGFAMYQSMVSAFNVVDATPFKRDPMKELVAACKKAGIKLGFYYSQFQDWHEPNGGGNVWDFEKKNKDYKQYYASKAVPQIKELLTNYGDIGLIWFDTPGDMTAEESKEFLNKVKEWQPNCLVSSRVGNGQGDYKDFGDSEVPVGVVKEPWEAIATHNDSWGYSLFDENYKTPKEIIHLLSTVSSKGGNLLLNIGPLANGKIPEKSVSYFTATGDWLKKNGESIYGSTYSTIRQQVWGVTTNKPGKIYVHIFKPSFDGQIFVPIKGIKVNKTYWLENNKTVASESKADGIYLNVPGAFPDVRDAVVVIDYKGELKDDYTANEWVNMQFDEFSLLPSAAQLSGKATVGTVRSSLYFGDWKWTPCVQNMVTPADEIQFKVDFAEKGDYKLSLEYSANEANENQEGILTVNGKESYFSTLKSGERDVRKPLSTIKQTITILTVKEKGTQIISIKPAFNGKELFKLKRVIIEPVF